MSDPRIDLCRGWAGVPGWLAESEAGVLKAAVRSTPPGTAIVELGRWCGRSLICLADARASQDLACPCPVRPSDPSTGATVTAIGRCVLCNGTGRLRRPIVSYDSYPEVSQAAEAAKDGCDGITPHEAKSIARAMIGAFNVADVHLRDLDAVEGAADYRASLATYGFKVGLLYIDDDHSGERVIAELAAWEPLMIDEAEVCIHDFFHAPYGIEAAIDRFLHAHPEWVRIEEQLSTMRLRRRWKAEPREPSKINVRTGLNGSLTLSGRTPHLHGHNGPLDPGDDPPLISVLYNTWRLGGLDCLKTGLDRQTADLSRVELVIVDALYPFRWKAVAELFKDAPYRVKHLNPTGNPFPCDHGNLARNDAIRAAEGRVCVWWCDYSIAERESLERHYRKVERSGWKANSCGHIAYGHIYLAALHQDFRAALPFRTIDDYADFVAALPPDSPLWTSIFNAPPLELGGKGLVVGQHGHGLPYELREKVKVSASYVVLDDLGAVHVAADGSATCKRFVGSFALNVARDVRAECLNGPAPMPDLYYAKNEATARDLLIEINGWEESFDDGHCCDDMDICRRFAKVGSTMVIDNGNECFVPNPRPFFPLMRWRRATIENRRLFETLRDIDRPRAIRGIVNELHQIPQPTEAAAHGAVILKSDADLAVQAAGGVVP